MNMTISFRRLIPIIALLMLSCVAEAASLSYSSVSRKIAAGVINPVPTALSTPYSTVMSPFYVMDARDDLKPNGWSFYNPLPLNTVSNDEPAYWTVRLSSISATDIVRYDVLLLVVDPGYTYRFNRMEREKLRKFVDGGGILWIDYDNRGSNGGVLNSASTFFMTRADKVTGSIGFAATTDTTASIPSAVIGHPLTARPFPLSMDDLQYLGGDYAVTDGSGSLGSPDVMHFSAVMTDGVGNPIVSAAEYGSGRVVVTSNRLAAKICTFPADPISMELVSESDVLTVPSACLELAYNIVNWGAEFTSAQKDSRHSGFSYADIGGGLSRLWTYPAASPATNPLSAAMLDDAVFYVDGNKVFHIFDMSPFKSRFVAQDSSGPMQASTKGAPYIEVPVSGSAAGFDLGSTSAVSAPTAAYVPSASGVSVPSVFVTVQTGTATTVEEFYLDISTTPATWKGPVDLSSSDPDFALSTTPFLGNVPSPVYVDGSVYAVDAEGTIHCKDLIYGHTSWKTPASHVTDYGKPSGSPTIGFVRDPSNGAMTRMAYLGTSGDGASNNGAVLPFPLHVYNEPLTNNLQGSGTTQLTIRNPNSAVDALDWSVYMPVLVQTTDNPLGINETGTIGSSSVSSYASLLAATPNAFQIDLAGLFGAFDGSSSRPQAKGSVVIADYGVDHPSDLVYNQNRKPIDVKSYQTDGNDGIIGIPALGPTDLLNFSTYGSGTLGSIYAVREGGKSSTRAIVKWRVCLEDDYMKTLLGVAASVEGSPAVTKDRVYYAVDNGTYGYIVALKSDPTLKVNLGTPIDRTQVVTVSQIDSMNSSITPAEISGVPSDVSDTLSGTYATFLVDYEHGIVTFNNLRPTTAAASDLSTTQNIQITYTPASDSTNAGMEQKVLIPAFDGTKPVTSLNGLPVEWNNIAWVLQLKDGDRPSSSPVVMGNHLYIGCKAVGVSPNSYANLYSIDLSKAESNAVSSATFPLPYTDTSVFLNSVSDYDILATVAGANGMMAVVTQEGLTMLHNSVSLVTDAKRIVEIDSSGNLLWSCDATHFYNETNNNTISDIAEAFNHPSVARYVTGSEMVVADTGNNRIVQMEKSGRVLWQIKDFVDPTGLLPVGAPLTLNGPMDVSYWVDRSTQYPEYHYLIADTGNYRVLEIVARYVVGLNGYQNQLLWVTKTLDQGHQYKYTSAKRVVDPTSAVAYTMCVVSNYIPAGASSTGIETVGGAIVNVNMAGTIAQVVTDFGTGTPRLRNPIYFDRVFDTGLDYWDTIVDAGQYSDSGGVMHGPSVYAVHHDASGVVIGVRTFDNAAYSQFLSDSTIAQRPFTPVYAQFVLDGQGLLIVNRTTGVQGSYGEVLDMSWDETNTKFIPSFLTQSSGTTVTAGDNPYVPNQPTSVERRSY